VVRDGAGYGGHDDVAVDLRVDDHTGPIVELARLLELNDLFLTATTEEDKVVITPELDTEITALVRALGHDDLLEWAGTENFEMRVAPTGSWIDQRVLAILRGTGSEPQA
ncbi:MAG TPA: putative peptidoglycan binding domain-containing protein, partial [Nocardioides sp.]